jgi:predicted nucleic acid-binding protein
MVASLPAWLLIRVPAAIESIPALHAGELAAISLAQELKADVLLIDELRGRKAAAERQIPVTGTIGMLELAASRGLLDLRDAFARIKNTDFWITGELLDERLRLYLAGRPLRASFPRSEA